MKIHLLMHLDGGNRGCEAITKSTAFLLKKYSSWMCAYTKNEVLDTFLGINNFCILKQMRVNFFKKCLRGICRRLIKNAEIRKRIYFHLLYYPYMKKIKSDDLYLSTGGDMMCYVDNEVIYTNNYLHKKGVKTILWGCSMGKENATPAKLETLKNFSAIYSRESLSYAFFKELGLKNVFLLPDPAFVLKPQSCELPNIFVNNGVVGINLSNYVLKDETFDSDKSKQVLELFDYILEKTNYCILLIPHVFWDGQNDKLVCEKFKSKYGNCSRVSLLDCEKMNYCEIRYVISKCKFFIGARTHSVISAYSMFVPTIALGYSIKSRGIAKDVGLPENLVVDFSKDLCESVLLDAFLYLMENEMQIKFLLVQKIPPYVKQLENFDFSVMLK